MTLRMEPWLPEARCGEASRCWNFFNGNDCVGFAVHCGEQWLAYYESGHCGETREIAAAARACFAGKRSENLKEFQISEELGGPKDPLGFSCKPLPSAL